MTTNKRRRLSSLFFQLPHEIVQILISNLHVGDLVSLGRCSSEYHSFLKPYIYNCISLKWDDLLKLEKGELKIDRVRSFVECLKIKEYDLRKEWNYDYPVLMKAFNNLKVLKMNISNSSNFLKYLSGNGLKLDELELKSMNSEANIFSIDHLRKIEVEKLKLEGFLLDFEDLDEKIKSLQVVDCYWNYPFEIYQFKKLRELVLNYSNEFILSERFRRLLMDPSLPFLEKLVIINNNPELRLYITNKNINLLCEKLPKLQMIELEGNIIGSQTSSKKLLGLQQNNNRQSSENQHHHHHHHSVRVLVHSFLRG